MSKYYRLKDLQNGPVPASRSTIDGWLAAGSDFPRPIKLGARMVARRSEDIDQWLERRRLETPAALQK